MSKARSTPRAIRQASRSLIVTWRRSTSRRTHSTGNGTTLSHPNWNDASVVGQQALNLLLPAVGGRSAGAIISGGGCDALGGAIGGCVSCGAAGCGFCAPAVHG